MTDDNQSQSAAGFTHFILYFSIFFLQYGYSLYDDYLKTQEELEALLLAGSRSTLSSGVASSISSSLNEAKSESSLVCL